MVDIRRRAQWRRKRSAAPSGVAGRDGRVAARLGGDGLRKVLAGVTSIEEVLRVAGAELEVEETIIELLASKRPPQARGRKPTFHSVVTKFSTQGQA